MTTKTDQNIFQDKLLSALHQEQAPVSLFLMNGICLQGRVKAFDGYVVLLENNGIVQAVYKHAMSTILPSRAVLLDDMPAPEVTIKQRPSLGVSGLGRIGHEYMGMAE